MTLPVPLPDITLVSYIPPKPLPPTPPPAPTGLNATAGDAQVTLSWSTASGVTSYNVKQASVSGGPYTTIASGVTAISYTNTGLTNGTAYYYVVSGVNSLGEGANSAQVSATPQPPTPPPAPTGITATAGDTQVSLSWSAAFGATSYNVKQATISGGPYTTVASGVTFTSYTNTGLANGTAYYYVVSGVNSAGEGADSAQVTISPVAGPLVVQSETGTWDAGGVAETVNAGYTGTGYVNTANAVGAYSEVTVNVATAGSYSIDFRYANGTAVDRPADLSINGTVVQAAVSFPVTGAWTTWADVVVTKTLNAGNNTIRLTATTANGDANLDKVSVQ
jgi:cellulose 1,4-beta-cellobiosidase